MGIYSQYYHKQSIGNSLKKFSKDLEHAAIRIYGCHNRERGRGGRGGREREEGREGGREGGRGGRERGERFTS